MAFCPQCGANTPEGATQCPQCGSQLNAVQQTQQQNTVPQGNPNVYQGVPQNNVPPVGMPQTPPPANYQPKSKIAAGILGILLGSLGVHNFYLGYTGKAVAQLLITLLTCGFGGAISGIWGLIEGIMILTGSIKVDGHNVPLQG